MNDLFKIIRQEPQSLLPEISLRAWMHFYGGYRHRRLEDQGSFAPAFDRMDFHRWLCDRFQILYASPIADVSIVSSFFLSEETAFYKYFDLLEEYLRSQEAKSPDVYVFSGEKEGFAGLVRGARKCPAMYIGSQTFLGFCSMLMGDIFATVEMGSDFDAGQLLFIKFQKWVEATKNHSEQFRHWFKIVNFWSIDDHSAYTLFCAWLDEFSKEAGNPDIFRSPA
ncbi:hypothetical protein ACFPT7_16060 [Acidicapsa dinghuensis]|uniref:Uncharacterized protein n=1 Tax=Acidicapsa dinghuensis TaxID=2218256 RepID=A0ABW1EI99_9BACT|nr:hypothetical protein [Acidicapsa dinghuensis]